MYDWKDLLWGRLKLASVEKPWSSWVKAAASIDLPPVFYFTTLWRRDKERLLPDCWLPPLLVVLQAFIID